MARYILRRQSALGDVLMVLPIATLLNQSGHTVALATDHKWIPLMSRCVALEQTSARPQRKPGDILIDLARVQRFWRRGLAPGSAWDPLRRAVGLETQLDRGHTLMRYAAAIGLNNVELPVPCEGALLDLQSDRGNDKHDVLRLGLVLGAGHASKALPPETAVAVTQALLSKYPRLRPVWIGGAGDKLACHHAVTLLHYAAPSLLSPDWRCLDATPLGLGAMIAGCDLVIGGDTGPMHLAQALNVPAVVVFGPTSPQRWGPWRSNAYAVTRPIACRPCSGHGQKPCRYGHRACMNDLPHDAIIQAAKRLLGSAPL